MNQNGFLKPKIKTGFDFIPLVLVRLTLWTALSHTLLHFIKISLRGFYEMALCEGATTAPGLNHLAPQTPPPPKKKTTTTTNKQTCFLSTVFL